MVLTVGYMHASVNDSRFTFQSRGDSVML